MGVVLDRVNKPTDLKVLSYNEKEELAQDIREEIIKIVSKNGGHLASNLGMIEITIALHSVLDLPKDKVIWDVGHQCYTHKILTERKEKFYTLRKLDGIAGFPKTSESKYDTFDTGHSSTSLSVAAGFARARDILKQQYQVIAIIGDGALTGGMALEALNDIGSSKTNITVILNDNEMSISKNVGGISLFLSKLRTRKTYTIFNDKVKRRSLKIPMIGNKIVKISQKFKRIIKQIVLPNMFFEDIGFTYLGPVDGHNIKEMEEILKRTKEIKGPIIIHAITKKGKGYEPAENNPDKFHGVSSFNIETGEANKTGKKDYSKVFGDKLVKLAEKNKKIVAVTAAMTDGTGLKEFSQKYPNRFFDVGITEQHAVGMIAGMAKAGLKPVFAVYSSFLQRAYDQLLHDIAIQNLPVTICVDRAGIVGNDGETHQGIFDLSFLNTIPNLIVMSPKDFKELEQMLEFAIGYKGPTIIRYPRGTEGQEKFDSHDEIKLGKSEILLKGKDITIIAIGKMVEKAVEAAKTLEKEKIEVEVINTRFLKPIDEKVILKSIQKTKRVITIEDNIIKCGLGSTINDLILKNNMDKVKIKNLGYNSFVEHGKTEELEKKYGLNVEKIIDIARTEIF